MGLELEGDDSRTVTVIVSVEIRGTAVRLIREEWKQRHFAHDPVGSRAWVTFESDYRIEVDSGRFDPENAIAFAAALRAAAERAVSLRSRDEGREPMGRPLLPGDM